LEHDSLGELILADSICREANSNAVVLIKNNMLIGRGFGQQDRIACVQLCLFYARRAGHDTQGAVFGSDGFFPFAEHKTAPDPKELRQALGLAALAEVPIPDKLDGVLAAYAQWDNREGPELLVAAGCQGGVVPGDGEQLGAVRAYFKKHGLTVVYLPPEHRAFSGH
jgi:hypothetical protein